MGLCRATDVFNVNIQYQQDNLHHVHLVHVALPYFFS